MCFAAVQGLLLFSAILPEPSTFPFLFLCLAAWNVQKQYNGWNDECSSCMCVCLYTFAKWLSYWKENPKFVGFGSFLRTPFQYFHIPGTPLTRSVTTKSHWPEASLDCHNFCWENGSGIQLMKNESTESQTQTSGNSCPIAGILCTSHETFFYLQVYTDPKWIAWCLCVKKSKATRLILYINVCVCSGICDFVGCVCVCVTCVCLFHVCMFLIKKVKTEILNKTDKSRWASKSRLSRQGKRPTFENLPLNFQITE